MKPLDDAPEIIRGATEDIADIKRGPVRYLTRSELAERIGVKPNTLNRYTLPDPDAVFGDRYGYLPATVDRWNAARPGRGRWGRDSDTAAHSTE